jgi:CheY-like chemotaxis protein
MTATLLLADDSPTIQRVIELTFADEDVRVVAVGDGDAAIKSMEQQPPDIVLADVGMPFKTGYEVASYVKQSPRLSHIPVVLLTGAFEPIDQRKADESGCDGVLAKPFEPQLVVARVKELLARPRAAVPVTEPANARPAPLSAQSSAPLSASLAAPLSAPPQIAPAPVPAAASVSESLGDFFDKLDEAFANLPAAQRAIVQPELIEGDGGAAPPFTPPPAAPPAASPEDADDLWDIDPPAASDGDLPSFLAPPNEVNRASAPPAPAPTRTPPVHTVSPAVVAPAASVAAATPDKPAMPALADAFATLLAAEEPGAAPANTAAWVRPPSITDELVERVADRVLERLSERAVHETTAEVVSPIVARMVLEEIDRIKAAIKDL